MEWLGKAFPCIRGLYLLIGERLNLSGFVCFLGGNRGDICWVVTTCQHTASLLPWEPLVVCRLLFSCATSRCAKAESLTPCPKSPRDPKDLNFQTPGITKTQRRAQSGPSMWSRCDECSSGSQPGCPASPGGRHGIRGCIQEELVQ